MRELSVEFLILMINYNQGSKALSVWFHHPSRKNEVRLKKAAKKPH